MPPSHDWAVVVLPDTQIYARARPDLFEAQTRWIVEARERERILCVLHEGDVTDDNSPEQWASAARAIRRLDGHVPYVVALGNHDYGPRGTATSRHTSMMDHLDAKALSAAPTLGGTFEPGRFDNVWHGVETPHGPWLALALEFAPRDATIAWAREVLDRHRDVPAMVVTHAYLYSDGRRYDAARGDQLWHPHLYALGQAKEGGADGEQLYRALIEPCSNVRLVFSGHVLNEGAALLTDVRKDGTSVHQMLANYQHRREGGASALRILRFRDGGRRVEVRSYLPAYDEHWDDERNAFDLVL